MMAKYEVVCQSKRDGTEAVIFYTEDRRAAERIARHAEMFNPEVCNCEVLAYPGTETEEAYNAKHKK